MVLMKRKSAAFLLNYVKKKVYFWKDNESKNLKNQAAINNQHWSYGK